MFPLILTLALVAQETPPAPPAAQEAAPPAEAPAPPPATEPAIESVSGGKAVATAPPLAPGETETLTRVRYTVNAEGRIEGCTIVESDAPEPIQQNICATLTERARFKPKLEDGKPVAVEQEKTVRFRVKAEGQTAAIAPALADPAKPIGRTDLPPGR